MRQYGFNPANVCNSQHRYCLKYCFLLTYYSVCVYVCVSMHVCGETQSEV